MKTIRRLVCFVLVGAATGAAASDTDAVFAREIRRGTDIFEFSYRLKVPTLTNSAKLWIPLGRSDVFQKVEATPITSLKLREIAEKEHDNRILFAELEPQQSGKTIEAIYQVTRKEKTVYPAIENPAAYLKPDLLVPVNETFASLARTATDGKATVMEKARALYDHTRTRMKYDKSGTGWGRGDAEFACDARAGNCTDFHAYFIALARSIGIPARFAIGFTIPADKSAGVIAGYHCWAEFMADGKWVPVDISEASKNPELVDYYFGHHPANRFQFTRGRDLRFEPAPASSPVNFLIYPLLEVNGQIIQTANEFTFRRIQ